MIRTNVLVIGGGPAGSVAARFLAENGIDTIIAERDISYIKPCGGGIPSTGLQELNIPHEVARNKIKKLLVVSPRGERVGIELKGGYLCITERGKLDATLRRMATEKGASLIEASFICFDKTGSSIISVVRKKSGEELRIMSNYIIASDGITSRVASALPIKMHFRHLYTISAHMKPAYTLHPEGECLNRGDTCEFWFSSDHAPNFYSWVFPSPEYFSIGTGSPNPRQINILLDKFIRRRFDGSVKGGGNENLLSRTRAFRIPEWNGTVFNMRNVLFAGDAAGTVMPVTYEGIYYAMKSGEFAARAIIEGKPHVYRKLWNSRFRRRFMLMSKIRDYLFKNDSNIEKFITLHKRQDVQEIAMRLWLRKESESSSLISYLKFFNHLLKS